MKLVLVDIDNYLHRKPTREGVLCHDHREVNINEITEMIKEHWYILLLLSTVFAFIFYIYSPRERTSYKASALFFPPNYGEARLLSQYDFIRRDEGLCRYLLGVAASGFLGKQWGDFTTDNDINQESLKFSSTALLHYEPNYLGVCGEYVVGYRLDLEGDSDKLEEVLLEFGNWANGESKKRLLAFISRLKASEIEEEKFDDIGALLYRFEKGSLETVRSPDRRLTFTTIGFLLGMILGVVGALIAGTLRINRAET